MTYYLQVNQDNIITDAITYPYGNYIEYEADSLPVGVMGGWFKLEDGQIVEYSDLKPISKDEEIESLKQSIAELTILLATATV